MTSGEVGGLRLGFWIRLGAACAALLLWGQKAALADPAAEADYRQQKRHADERPLLAQEVEVSVSE